jgi:F-type H+-transporting ATPase subunit epsilon
MHLKILLPAEVFIDISGVSRIVAKTQSGSFGILPRRLDCVAPLSPGILVYEKDLDGEAYIAIDEGILIKSGESVLVSVRHAIPGRDLDRLRAAVRQKFLDLDEQERSLRTALNKMESGLIRRMIVFQHEKRS